MTSPSTPGDALGAAGKRLQAQREAARKASEQIAADRAAQAPPVPVEAPERTP